MSFMSTKGVNAVGNDNSGKLVKHIDEAKDWLDKAKQEYTQANPVRGELILNLAQAEIKYAWELSHVRFVSHNNNQSGFEGSKLQIRRFRPKVVLPIAAAVLVIFAASLIWFGGRNLNLKLQSVAVNKKEATVTEAPGIVIQPTIPGTATDTQTNGKTVAVVSSNPSGTPAGESKPESNSKTIARVQPSGNSTTSAETSGESNRLTENRKDLPYGNNQTNLQPVSQLTIDVDALTKEAAHSLRNGK
jgi:hypothetical protein